MVDSRWAITITVLPYQPGDGALDYRLILWVDVCCGFVKDDHRGIL